MSDLLLGVSAVWAVVIAIVSVRTIINTRNRHYEDYIERHKKRPVS